MKKLLALLILISIAALAFMPQAVAAAENPYLKEVPLKTFRAHGGDRGEIQESFEALVKALQDGEDGTAFLAEGVAKEDVEAYFEKLAALEDVSVNAVRTNLFYQVGARDVYFDYRAFVSIAYQSKVDGKPVQYCDQLALAKLGDKTTDWKVFAVNWSDPGIDVSEIPVIQLDSPEKGEEICVIETDIGPLKLRLFPDSAPKAVENFKALAGQGYYDGMPFNRVYNDFVIQTGQLDGSGKESESSFGGFFEDEFVPNLFNLRGALAMGNIGPNTNGNQFYIVQKPSVSDEHLDLGSFPDNVKEKYRELGGLPYLDMRYTVFGQVFEGLDLVDKIAQQEADDDGMPLKDPIKIVSVKFEPFE